MEMRQLGASTLKVSSLGLGGLQFGYTANEDASFAVMDAYFEAGGNFLDTANIYTRWASGHSGGESDSQGEMYSRSRFILHSSLVR